MSNFTDIWQGEIEYGPFKRSVWLAIPNQSHPLFHALINDLRAIEEFAHGYSLYVFGGILEDWLSWDIDVAITGEYRPEILKPLMHKILDVSFKRGIYIDLKFILNSDVFDFRDWLRDSEMMLTEYVVIEYSDKFLKNGVSQEFNNISEMDGLWRRSIYLPSRKQLSKMEEGYHYASPIKII
jgi:hypothetical protein